MSVSGEAEEVGTLNRVIIIYLESTVLSMLRSDWLSYHQGLLRLYVSTVAYKGHKNPAIYFEKFEW